MDKTTSDTLKQVPMVAEPMTSYPADMNVPISTDSQKQVPMVAIPIMQPPEDTDYLGFTGQVPMVAISLTEEEALRIISDPSYTSSADLDAVGKLPNVENLSISTPIDQQKLEPATVVILNHEIFENHER
ncbi:uncharacterized protein Dana_GF26282 [Drosophila ananassae]|uniref:Uncharacterized protein n=1 Tax=Drosophila ananassae TaxID=7217 RepID=A0A0P8ZP31_DROAN|nr:uncharacterized protein LOC26513691 [Drosophila ananassae]KPU76387.1 uncharacterized protein Dana_GF26282 [Drosophila ananassae]